jgi:hypothetical protein
MNLGLDELMIVNPGLPPSSTTTWFLGEDGGLYQISPLGEDANRETALGDSEPLPSFFLGDDGTLYERT